MTINSKLFLMTLCLATIALGGCSNTLDGAGRDMKGMGEWVEDTF
ncbi:MAG TPA: entericidin EcnAB [Alphaproteobacteria bacterium]|nr:entericidin EcnAB [Alphaproteobacteria bacterium]